MDKGMVIRGGGALERSGCLSGGMEPNLDRSLAGESGRLGELRRLVNLGVATKDEVREYAGTKALYWEEGVGGHPERKEPWRYEELEELRKLNEVARAEFEIEGGEMGEV